jgi:hypothetical protein
VSRPEGLLGCPFVIPAGMPESSVQGWQALGFVEELGRDAPAPFPAEWQALGLVEEAGRDAPAPFNTLSNML